MCRQVSLASRGVVASVHAKYDIQPECAPDTAKASLYFRILLGERCLDVTSRWRVLNRKFSGWV